tara:strand:+ start:961 stop:1767 length:807 start_codon:yes stop_codon:yes gene_type:complete
MKSLLKCLSVTIFCLLLIGCGEQNTVTNNPTERDQLSNNSNTQAEDDDNLDLLNPSQAQTEHDQLASEDLSQDEVIGENTDLNLASLVDSRSVKPTSSIGNSVPIIIQSNYENCGPASLASVLRYHGLSDSQSQIAQKTTNGNGAGTTDLVDYAVSRGFHNTREISRDFHGDSLTALQNRVAERPQIVVVGPQSGNEIIYNYPQSLNPEKNWGGNFFRSSPNNHYVVVQSFTPEGNPVLMDPARAELGRVVADRAWFDRHWIHTVDVA